MVLWSRHLPVPWPGLSPSRHVSPHPRVPGTGHLHPGLRDGPAGDDGEGHLCHVREDAHFYAYYVHSTQSKIFFAPPTARRTSAATPGRRTRAPWSTTWASPSSPSASPSSTWWATRATRGSPSRRTRFSSGRPTTEELCVNFPTSAHPVTKFFPPFRSRKWISL